VAEFVAPVESTVVASADEDVVEGVLRAAWKAVVDAAAVSAESARAALVALVVGVRTRTVDGHEDVRIRGRRVFADLPVFRAPLREAWHRAPPAGHDAPSWTNLNALAAQLTAAGEDLSLLGLWSIGLALETFDDAPVNLPAAVQWFRYCGQYLVSATLHGRTYGSGPGRPFEPAERGGLSEGGFNVPRWTFWRSRLEGLARDGDPVARQGLRYVRRYDAQIAGGQA